MSRIPFSQFLPNTKWKLLKAESVPDAHSTVLIDAVKNGDIAVFKKLLSSKAVRVSNHDNEGGTALHFAAQRGNKDMVESLINHRADVNALDERGRTPLHWAVNAVKSRPTHCYTCVEILLSHGADSAITDRKGQIPLFILLKNGPHSREFDATFALLTNHRNVNFIDQRGRTPLMMAVSAPNVESTKRLLDAFRAPIDPVDNQGATALHHAVVVDTDDFECIYLLFKRGATIGVTDNRGRSPFIVAMTNSPPHPIFHAIQRAVEGSESQLLSLRDKNAQIAFYILKQELDLRVHSALSRNQLRRMLLKLAKENNCIPEYIYLDGHVRQHYSLQKYEMTGSNGTVIRCGYFGPRDDIVALKKLKVEKAALDQTNDSFNFVREALVWRHLKHPHILPFLGVEKTSVSNEFVLVSPFMKEGTMAQYLKDNNNCTEEQCEQWLLEVVKGLCYLHHENVVHGDIRGDNVFLSDQYLCAKVGDFGMTIYAESTTATLGVHTFPPGNARWLSPELMTKTGQRPMFSDDVFSFGRIFIEAYTHFKPFSTLYPSENENSIIANRVKNECLVPDHPVNMPNALYTLALQCWHIEAIKRPSMDVVQDELQKMFSTKS